MQGGMGVLKADTNMRSLQDYHDENRFSHDDVNVLEASQPDSHNKRRIMIT